jgi:hypothetical protein
MLSGLGIVSRIMDIPLILAEKVANHAPNLGLEKKGDVR